MIFILVFLSQRKPRPLSKYKARSFWNLGLGFTNIITFSISIYSVSVSSLKFSDSSEQVINLYSLSKDLFIFLSFTMYSLSSKKPMDNSFYTFQKQIQLILLRKKDNKTGTNFRCSTAIKICSNLIIKTIYCIFLYFSLRIGLLSRSCSIFQVILYYICLYIFSNLSSMINEGIYLTSANLFSCSNIFGSVIQNGFILLSVL